MGQGRHTLRSVSDPVYPRPHHQRAWENCECKCLKQSPGWSSSRKRTLGEFRAQEMRLVVANVVNVLFLVNKI